MRAVADQVVCLIEPKLFFSVGHWYDNFEPVEDWEVCQILDGSYGENIRAADGVICRSQTSDVITLCSGESSSTRARMPGACGRRREAAAQRSDPAARPLILHRKNGQTDNQEKHAGQNGKKQPCRAQHRAGTNPTR